VSTKKVRAYGRLTLTAAIPAELNMD